MAFVFWCGVTTLFAIGFMNARREGEEARLLAESMSARQEGVLALLESGVYGIAMLDDRGLVTYWNPAMEKMSGRTQQEMLGKDILMVMPEDKREKHANGYAAIINNPKAVGKTIPLPCVIVPKDPEKKPIPVLVNVRIVKGKSPGARPHGVAMIDRATKVVELKSDKPLAEALEGGK